MRINQYLAGCGVASRRKSEQLVLDGRVKVNGRVVTDLATDIKEDDVVTLDGKRLQKTQNYVYIMLNKPKGYLTTVSDDRGRKTVLDLIDIKDVRLFPVGRLDYDTEGLLILTNDGNIANVLTHPKNKIEKTYIARVQGFVLPEHIEQLKKGVIIDGKKTLPAKARILEYGEDTTRLEIIITEGRNRQVRKMLASLGFETQFLKRASIGMLRLGGLSRGKYRHLNQKEVLYLKSLQNFD